MLPGLYRQYRITNPFGVPGPYISGYHTGVDFAENEGAPWPAAFGGQVIDVTWNDPGYGNYVVIRDIRGGTQKYGHASQIYVSIGNYVQAGDIILAVGHTGFATGPHVHYETHDPDGNLVNPEGYDGSGGGPVLVSIPPYEPPVITEIPVYLPPVLYEQPYQPVYGDPSPLSGGKGNLIFGVGLAIAGVLLLVQRRN